MIVKVARKNLMADPITKGEMIIVDSGERFHSYLSRMGIDLNRGYTIDYDRPYDYRNLIIFQRDRTRILIEKFFKYIRTVAEKPDGLVIHKEPKNNQTPNDDVIASGDLLHLKHNPDDIIVNITVIRKKGEWHGGRLIIPPEKQDIDTIRRHISVLGNSASRCIFRILGLGLWHEERHKAHRR